MNLVSGYAVVATPGTPVRLSTTPFHARRIEIVATKPAGANTGIVYRGTNVLDDSRRVTVNKDATGVTIGVAMALSPGDSWVREFISAMDISQIWIDAATANDGVYFEAEA